MAKCAANNLLPQASTFFYAEIGEHQGVGEIFPINSL